MSFNKNFLSHYNSYSQRNQTEAKVSGTGLIRCLIKIERTKASACVCFSTAFDISDILLLKNNFEFNITYPTTTMTAKYFVSININF